MAGSKTLALTTTALIIANLVPLAGVVFFGWTVFDILLLFWAENLIIGAINVAKYGILYRRRNHGMLLVYIPFFCIHYGGFAIAHLTALLHFFGPADPGGWSPVALAIPLASLAVSHVHSLLVHFIGRKEYLDASHTQLMFQPYTRVMALHVALLAGGGVVMWMGEPLLALVILVLMKIAFDVPAHRREHRDKLAREQRRQARADGTAPPRDPVFKGWGDADADHDADHGRPRLK
jgi:heme exporter protein D